MNRDQQDEILALAIRVRVAAPSVDAYALAANVMQLLNDLAHLQRECSEAHRHYCEATHGEWREKARADRAEDQRDDLAHLLTPVPAELAAA